MWRLLWVVTAFGIPISYIPSTRIPPSGRLYSVIDYNKFKGTILLFSGLDSNGYTNDLWSFSFSKNYWDEQNPSSEKIPGISYLDKRINSGCFSSEFSPSFYIFGGMSNLGILNDLWEYQILNLKWIELDTINPPTPRYNYAYSSYVKNSIEYFIVFGGSTISGEDNDLYM